MKKLFNCLFVVFAVIACKENKPNIQEENKSPIDEESQSNLNMGVVQTQEECTKNGGFWYNGKCWYGYEDEEGFSKESIDSVVNARLRIFEKTTLSINNENIDAQKINIGWDDEAITVFEQGGERFSLILEESENWLKESDTSFTVKAHFLRGDALSRAVDFESVAKGTLSVKSANGDFTVTGKLSGEEKKFHQIHFFFNRMCFGAGTTKIIVRGNEAYLSGDLGTKAYDQIKKLISEYPEVKTLVLTFGPGSMDDAVNMHTGRLIREAGLNTKVLANSEIFSGAVDLFCSGNERIVERGAVIGIHSWCCVNEATAAQLPEDHPAHRYQIKYFTMCLGDIGRDFYFLTLDSAEADNMYVMSNEEIKEWNVATKFIEPNTL